MFHENPTFDGLFFIPLTSDLQMSGFGREYSGIDGTSFAIIASACWKSAARFAGSSSLFDASRSRVACRLQ